MTWSVYRLLKRSEAAQFLEFLSARLVEPPISGCGGNHWRAKAMMVSVRGLGGWKRSS
jgi:hypothetical protein